jgi:hypothetical protein
MARVIALAQAQQDRTWFEVLRICIVCGCAIALIAADKALPF